MLNYLFLFFKFLYMERFTNWPLFLAQGLC